MSNNLRINNIFVYKDNSSQNQRYRKIKNNKIINDNNFSHKCYNDIIKLLKAFMNI